MKDILNSTARLLLPALLSLLASCGRPVSPVHRTLSAVTFLDVGQGDAALIRTASGKTILIDAGSRQCGSDTLLSGLGVRQIDELVISHAHEDHYGNVRRILDAFPVKRVIFNRAVFDSGADPGFMHLHAYVTDSLRLDTLVLSAGRSIQEDSASTLRCLWPDTAPLPPDIDDTVNALSLVLQIRMGAASLLFTGDINFGVEKRLVDMRDVRSAILKVAHHGSRSAGSHAFLEAVSPLISVISVGTDNTYGHPEEELLERLNSCGGRIFRTDRDGSKTFRLEMDGEVLQDGK